MEEIRRNSWCSSPGGILGKKNSGGISGKIPESLAPEEILVNTLRGVLGKNSRFNSWKKSSDQFLEEIPG